MRDSESVRANNSIRKEVVKIEFPFDFPMAKTKGAKGDWVLVPRYQAIQEVSADDLQNTTLLWVAKELFEPGENSSMVSYSVGPRKVPNAYIVPLMKDQSAKVGDILLTWWQSGSGLQRAIVTEASDPKRPKVRYLDIEYDNPAKSWDKTTTIGQMDEQLKPDTFIVLRNQLEPGTAVSIGKGKLHGQIIKSSKDKVFVKLFAGRIAVHSKSEVRPIPIRPNVKKHDSVLAKRFGRLEEGLVSEVDERIGRVWVRFDEDAERTAVAFGNLIKNPRRD